MASNTLATILSKRLPEGWRILEINDRSSQIAYFEGGAKFIGHSKESANGDEVLIWHGSESESGDIHLTPHFRSDVPEDTKFVIEIFGGNGRELSCKLFASSESEALEKALASIRVLRENGSEVSQTRIEKMRDQIPEVEV